MKDPSPRRNTRKRDWPVPTIAWVGGLPGKVRLVDQTRLPLELRFLECIRLSQLISAIKKLAIRGAPALGVAAAYGLVLGIQNYRGRSAEAFYRRFQEVSCALANSRPTARNLFWALERMDGVVKENLDKRVDEIKAALLDEAHVILEEDKYTCRQIGELGAELLSSGDTVLTHCNAGGLATADFGTALAVIFCAHQQGKKIVVYVDETRPLLQGARLTTWELMHAGIETILICDNMAATVMAQGKVNCVITGADRIVANGDVANKVGTYGLAVLAREHRIPFYVAAPVSTFDLSLKSGAEIPIEERNPKEVTEGFGRRTAPRGVKVYSPAFDITPARYITAIITDKGIIHRPIKSAICRTLG